MEFRRGQVMKTFKIPMVYSLHKKENVQCIENYRCISFIDCVAKHCSSTLNRLTSWVTDKSIINETQARFSQF